MSVLTGSYLSLLECLSQSIPPHRLIFDELRTLAYGTDASFYRLIPKLVVKVESEEEVLIVLNECRRRHIPLTFRAAGTSLSGQAISDSVLVFLGSSWKRIQISADGAQISLQPGVIGAHANLRLLPYGRKIGPDPASINSAMIGGIAANNASGMCCGTAQNSYRTVVGMKILFGDASQLDTRNQESRKQFCESHAPWISRLAEVARKAKENGPLAERIRRKYKMKNTTGYSLNALVDFEDPIDIIQHLMIGSEGTLGFIAEITYQTVPEFPCKATALMLFPDIKTACEATTLLRQCPVSAVEIMDRAALRSVEEKPGMPGYLKELDAQVAALLVESRSETRAQLHRQIEEVLQQLGDLPTVRPISFTQDPVEFTRLWNIRKGLFPSVGAIRQTGTTVIIEDVAFPIERLASATVHLQGLFRKHGYDEAIIFGHALEGNLHFVFTQDFNNEIEVRRYQAFIDDVTRMVVHDYDGSLKAEHGTGRNMAPFVELEWGREAFQLMKEIKEIFDPENLLNPGVILNPDPVAHLKNLKPLPSAHPSVDKCIECGFCEINCPSRDLTLTPRQRIVVWREISRLVASGLDPARLAALRSAFDYQGEKTCATDGLCALSCPVDIDTGKLVKVLRFEQKSAWADRMATLLANHMGAATAATRGLLNVVDLLHRLLGSLRMGQMAGLLRKLSGNRLPQWSPCLPRGADRIKVRPVQESNSLKAVYLPSCISRSMGIARDSQTKDSLNARTDSLLRKARFEVIYPENLNSLCCGMAFASKGFTQQGDAKLKELGKALSRASRDGQYPVLIDTSPCLYRLKESAEWRDKLTVYEPAEFIVKHLVPRLRFSRKPSTVALHVTCSSRKMGLESPLHQLAELCAEKVVAPDDVGCCGFAGDRGFTYPELNASALAPLKASLPDGCRAGYSTSITCEIGLSQHAGIPYQSIIYLVDECTQPSENCD